MKLHTSNFYPPSWTSHELAEAVPLRLFKVMNFEGERNTASNSMAAPTSRDWRRRDYLRITELPAFIRVR